MLYTQTMESCLNISKGMTVHYAQNKCVRLLIRSFVRLFIRWEHFTRSKSQAFPNIFYRSGQTSAATPTDASIGLTSFTLFSSKCTNHWNLSWFLMDLPSNMDSNCKINNWIEITTMIRMAYHLFSVDILFSVFRIMYWISHCRITKTCLLQYINVPALI